ncbi:MAG TPA: hypothetical protein VER96_32750 [Polyangiaceae bacterium]|nr:hypothetical protein [Polyangiaceae bacterium]
MSSSSSPTRVRLILFALVAAFCVIAVTQRWLQDDAFITYRYSRYLANGFGAVWNPGYAIEGYTNFLWMVLIAGCISLGIPAEVATHLLSIPMFAGSLLLVFAIATRVLKDARWGLVTTALTGANYSFLMYSTGGLETQLNTLLTLASLLLVVRASDEDRVTPGSAAALSTLVALAMMTRPDSVLLATVAIGFMAWLALKSRKQPTNTWFTALLLLAPALILLVPWLLWKKQFYGGIFPNTFYVKLGIHRPGTMNRGLAYVGWPFISYLWLPVLVFLAIKLRARLPRPERSAYPLLAYCALWLAYAVFIGGDIMEFRQLICVFPLIILLIVYAWRSAFPKLEAVAALAAIQLAGSVVHGLYFGKYERPPGIGNIPVLTSTTLRWCEMGSRLLSDLGKESGATIAVSPAGAIPFRSELRTIDILGLSDRWIARNGFVRQKCDVCLGHLRLSSFDYLAHAGANLVFGHPQESDFRHPLPSTTAVLEQMFYGERLDYANIPERARMVQIPLSGDDSFVALYLQSNPKIDALIANGTWKSQPLDRSGPLWAAKRE